MLIDQWLGKLWQVCLHYGGIVMDYPTHFERQHWIFFTAICVVIGCLCMQGFGSRKNY